MASLVFSLYRCPCPNRVSGKGEAYFLFAFSLSLFLVFGSCYPYLQDISDVWWLQVSCCGRSPVGTLFGRNPSTIMQSFVAFSGMQPWCFSFASEDCTAFLAVPSPCVFDALIWADTVTGWLTLVIHIGITWHRSFYVFTSFFRAMSYTIFRCKVSDSGARQGRTSCFARKKSK